MTGKWRQRRDLVEKARLRKRKRSTEVPLVEKAYPLREEPVEPAQSLKPDACHDPYR